MSYFDLTIDEKLEQADAFYAPTNSVRAYDWERNTTDERKAGLNQAEREVNLYLGINLEQSYSDTDFPIADMINFRPDYAIFEHALFILENTARTKADSDSGAQEIESTDYQEEERNHGVSLSPQAARYLQLNRIQLTRG